MEGVLTYLQNLLQDNGFCICICFIAGCVLKYKTAKLICKTPELSDNKAEAITKMISKKFFNSLPK